MLVIATNATYFSQAFRYLSKLMAFSFKTFKNVYVKIVGRESL